ncbi:18S rRNA biogenesis protein [Rhizoctonia solani]|uniref:18S rRNA biogenesis protein n=1 Tax=Rhizoctonia solani TaxID=456999 RepID=A0A8H7M0B8_9AGAM|nr:18S rRNA biogenesis protein [Rhizoctonia solani]
MPSTTTPNLVRFTGHNYFRQRITLSILSGKAVRIDGIRPDDQNPGLRADFEASFLRLVEKVTNGSIIEISYTGTSVLVKPGIISGGPVTHECPLSRSIGYFLEPLVAIGPFSKKPLSLTLKGITSDEKDLSADIIRTVTLPHLTLFGISDGVELKIKKRGAAPLGGGEIEFICPVVKQLKTLNFVDPGKIIRIRGIARHAVRVSSDKCPRMIDSCREVLNRYINDIYLVADVYRKDDSGKSPGFGMSLLATSTTGALHCSEVIGGAGALPNDIGHAASRSLLSEIRRGGCVDRHHQWLVLLLMVLGSEDVGRCRMGELTVKSVQFLRDVKQFFGTSFKIVPAPDSDSELMLSCFGTGYINSNKAIS